MQRQFSDEFTREQCEYLELNNIGMDNLELQMLPKIKASEIERKKIIGKSSLFIQLSMYIGILFCHQLKHKQYLFY